MFLRILSLSLCLMTAASLSLHAQADLFTLNNALPTHKILIHEGQKQGVKPTESRKVSIPVHLFAESEVKVEIRDALGIMRFESEGTYPEGGREIRIGMGAMDQGLYFIRVNTNWSEHTEIVVVERIP